MQQQQPADGLIGGRYKVLRKIGEGGMGEVYLAEHIYIEKRVAIKLLRADVLSNQEAVSRFRQEARSASSIGHDNIIQIDDFGALPDGRIYMAMEFLEGMALNDVLAREPLPLPRALDILIQVGRGLAAAHAKGITHRDMKPENIFVTWKEGRDVPKLLDFGIAKVTQTDSAQNLTVAGAIFGTPSYMSPEQAMGGKMDHRVDVYAMGVILYEIFCGVVPFRADTFMGILTQHITTEPVPPSQMAQLNGRVVPPQLEAIILRAMRKNPAERYQSMNELVNALMEFANFALGGDPRVQPWLQRASYSMPAQPVAARPAGRPRWLIAALAAGGAAAAAAVVVALVARGPAPVIAIVPDAARPDPVDTGTPDAAAARPSPPDAAPPDAPPAPPEPRMIQVTIHSTPAGARVYRGRTLLGVTPLVVEIEEGEAESYRLTRNAYLPATVRVDGSRGEVSVRLESELKLPE